MEPYSCLYLTLSLYLYIISVYMNVCILSDGAASCTVTLQKHSHPWSSCNDPEVIATAKFALFRLEKVRRRGVEAFRKSQAHSSSLSSPYHPLPVLSSFILHQQKTPQLTPNHPHHPLIHPLPGTRWRFRLYWRPRWFSKKLRFQEFILSSRSSSRLVVS